MNRTDAENRLSINDLEMYYWEAAAIRRLSE
jgi:hypothetical protein